MYNGIGLTTVRGSGTNGYVQTNKAFVRPSRQRYITSKHTGRDQLRAAKIHKPDAEILEHDRKRKLEVKVMELQVDMEDRGYAEHEIEEKVVELRSKLTKEYEEAKARGLTKKTLMDSTSTDSHVMAAGKEVENERARKALRLGRDYIPGKAFDKEYQEERKMRRKQEREDKEKEYQRRKKKEDEHRKKRDEERIERDNERRERRRNEEDKLKSSKSEEAAVGEVVVSTSDTKADGISEVQSTDKELDTKQSKKSERGDSNERGRRGSPSDSRSRSRSPPTRRRRRSRSPINRPERVTYRRRSYSRSRSRSPRRRGRYRSRSRSNERYHRRRRDNSRSRSRSSSSSSGSSSSGSSSGSDSD